MARPPKPWEKARPVADTELPNEGQPDLVAQVDEKFPDDDVEASGTRA